MVELLNFVMSSFILSSKTKGVQKLNFTTGWHGPGNHSPASFMCHCLAANTRLCHLKYDTNNSCSSVLRESSVRRLIACFYGLLMEKKCVSEQLTQISPTRLFKDEIIQNVWQQKDKVQIQCGRWTRKRQHAGRRQCRKKVKKST